MSKVIQIKTGDQLAQEAWDRYIAAVHAMRKDMTFDNGRIAAKAWHEFTALFALPEPGGQH